MVEIAQEIGDHETQAAIHRRRHEMAHGVTVERKPYFPAGRDELCDHEFMGENQALYADLNRRGMTRSTGDSLRGTFALCGGNSGSNPRPLPPWPGGLAGDVTFPSSVRLIQKLQRSGR